MLPRSKTSRPAFTIVEILVVVTIIVALIAILIPSVSLLKRQAARTATTSSMNALRTGLAQYYADFNMYPASSPTIGGIVAGHGEQMLAQGLLGYLGFNVDGAGTPNDPSDMGFRIKKGNAAMGGLGRIYGPYAPMEPKVYISNHFIDYWGNPILYYRSTKAQSPTTIAAVKTIFGTGAASDDVATYFFNTADCSAAIPSSMLVAPTTGPLDAPAKFFSLLGAASTPNTVAGTIDGSTSYLLLSAGPDEKFFTSDDIILTK